MSTKITNLTSRVVFVSLNSGSTLRLSPSTTSGEVEDVEVQRNPTVEKLQRRGIIAIEQTADEASPPKPKIARAKSRTDAEENSSEL